LFGLFVSAERKNFTRLGYKAQFSFPNSKTAAKLRFLGG